MMSSRRSLLALVALALALLCALPACGAGDGSGGEGGGDGGAELGPAMTPAPDDEGGGDDESEAEEDGEDEQASSSNEVSVGPAFSDGKIFAFGEAPVGGESEALSVTVRNRLNAPNFVTALDIVGTHPADFQVVENGCLPEVELPAQETCEATLIFSPTEPGPREAVLQITVSAGLGAQVRLSGTGVAG